MVFSALSMVLEPLADQSQRGWHVIVLAPFVVLGFVICCCRWCCRYCCCCNSQIFKSPIDSLSLSLSLAAAVIVLISALDVVVWVCVVVVVLSMLLV